MQAGGVITISAPDLCSAISPVRKAEIIDLDVGALNLSDLWLWCHLVVANIITIVWVHTVSRHHCTVRSTCRRRRPAVLELWNAVCIHAHVPLPSQGFKNCTLDYSRVHGIFCKLGYDSLTRRHFCVSTCPWTFKKLFKNPKCHRDANQPPLFLAFSPLRCQRRAYKFTCTIHSWTS